jgi:hypothetical protein
MFSNRRKAQEIPTKEEAIKNGWPLYGVVAEVYKEPDENADEAALKHMLGMLPSVVVRRIPPQSGEVLGTTIGMVSLASGRLVMGTIVERKYTRSERGYKRKVGKAIRQEAKTIRAHNRVLSEAFFSYLFSNESKPYAWPEIKRGE